MKQTPAIKSPPLSIPMANSHLLLSSTELTLRWVMGMLPSLDDPFWAQINLFLRQGVSMKKNMFLSGPSCEVECEKIDDYICPARNGTHLKKLWGFFSPIK